MSVVIHPSTHPLSSANDVVNADANRAGPESTSMESEHRVGNTVDKVDQLSSVTLLGLAIGGAAVMLIAHWLVH